MVDGKVESSGLAHNRILPLPSRPPKLESSPQLVLVLDRVRFDLDNRHELGEFVWFAREYPRIYRHHIEHAEFRLQSVYNSFEDVHKSLAKRILEEDSLDCFEMAVSDKQVRTIYWNFESYISALCAALDVLARICTTAFPQQVPISFKDFCKRAPESSFRDILRGAQTRWAQGMKDYRDCFIHYTPVDTILSLRFVRYNQGWQLRGKLPANPKAREILRFRWNRRSELLSYSMRVWKRFSSLDRKVAQTILRAYRSGSYPLRTTDLFRAGG